MLSAFTDILPWEWIHNAARWTYDESRHCRMGYERLMAWALIPQTFLWEPIFMKALPARILSTAGDALFLRNQEHPLQAGPRPAFPRLR